MQNIYSWWVYFKLQCNNKIFTDIINSPFLKIYIPSFFISKRTIKEDNIIQIVHWNNPWIKKIKTKFLIIHDEETSIEDIITLIEYCCSYFRQQKWIYSIHWSAISYNNTGILLWWSISWIWKTSTAINLCKKQWFSFIGDETIYITDKWKIINWSKKIFFNKPSMFTYLNNSFHNTNIENNWISTTTNKVTLKIMIQPIICSWWKFESIIRNDTKRTFHLYEEFSRRIRWCSRLINNRSVPIQSIDDENISEKRILCCKKIASNTTAYTLKWSMNRILNEIKKITLSLHLEND